MGCDVQWLRLYDRHGQPIAQRRHVLVFDVENRWIGELIDSNGDGTIDHETGFVYDGNQIVLQFDKDVSERATGSASALDMADLSHRYLWLANAVDQLMADEQLQGLSQFSSDENGTVPLGSASGGTAGSSSSEGYDLTTPGTVVWTLGDQQGTIKDLAVTENGTTSIVTHRVYDSYGNLISSSGSSRKNVFGGYDYKVKEKEKEQGQGRNSGKDVGNETSRTRTFSTRKNVFGGEDVTER